MLMIRPMREGDDFSLAQDKSYHLALNGETLLGYCGYRRTEALLLIEEVVDGGDIDLFDGLVRASLDAAEKAGIDGALFAETVDLSRCREIGLLQAEENCIKSIREFLTNCKHCRN